MDTRADETDVDPIFLDKDVEIRWWKRLWHWWNRWYRDSFIIDETDVGMFDETDDIIDETDTDIIDVFVSEMRQDNNDNDIW